MYARVSITPVVSGKSDEVVRIHRDSVVPACRAQKGFKGLWLLHDPKSDKGYTISLWETEADMKASEASGFYKQQVDKFTGVIAGPTVRETYEALFFE